MKASIQSNKRGIALVVVMAVLVAVTLLVAALLQLGYLNERETVRELRTTQAHWLAEAGLERAISMIKISKTYRESFISTAFDSSDDDPLLDGAGSYAVTILSTPGPGPKENSYEIESIGTFSNAAMSATAAVRVLYIGAPGVDQGLLGLGGESYIKQSASIDINGDVYIAGTGDVNRPIDGNLEDADDGQTVTYGGTTLPVDVLVIPPLDPATLPFNSTPTYKTLLNNAANTNTPGVVHGTYNGPFDLNAAANHIIYVDGNVNIENNVTGSGTIVSTGNVTFNKNNKTLAARVTVVANGDVNISASGIQFGENTVLFSGGNITVGVNQSFPTIGMGLLSMSNITVKANITFNGIMYANGKVLLVNGNQEITGTIIAGDGFDIQSNAAITYDSSVFPDPAPVDFLNNFTLTQSLQWEEEPYN